MCLPPHIARAAGLHAGTQVSLTVEAGRITITRVASLSYLLLKRWQHMILTDTAVSS